MAILKDRKHTEETRSGEDTEGEGTRQHKGTKVANLFQPPEQVALTAQMDFDKL